jgi:hypothetical protein
MLSQDEIIELLDDLSKKRPVFHSEADFQHALAWLIHEKYPAISIRLEQPFGNVGEIDILLLKDDSEFLLELKYKTSKTLLDLNGEQYHLKSHGAQPLGRYDGIKDISRVEQSERPGATIFLTNESQYWRVSPMGNGAAFSMQDERIIYSPIMLEWTNIENTNSIGAGRIYPIELRSNYAFCWRKFSQIGPNIFRYLLIMINP